MALAARASLWDHPRVRWLVTLSGGKQDVERLATASLPKVSAVEDAPLELLLELDHPEEGATGDDAAHAASAVIDEAVRGINGFGRLRWGRTFAGVEITKTLAIRADGHAEQRVSLGTAVDQMLFEDHADMVVRHGSPRPKPPMGLEIIRALDGEAVTTLASINAEVVRVLHLVNLMLDGDDEIDWVAAYAALEVIEQDLHARRLDGQDLGWWSKAERQRFTRTANSPELLGFSARHGWRRGPPKKRMTAKDASWFIRRAAALWVTDLLERTDEGPAIASDLR